METTNARGDSTDLWFVVLIDPALLSPTTHPGEFGTRLSSRVFGPASYEEAEVAMGAWNERYESDTIAAMMLPLWNLSALKDAEPSQPPHGDIP